MSLRSVLFGSTRQTRCSSFLPPTPANAYPSVKGPPLKSNPSYGKSTHALLVSPYERLFRTNPGYTKTKHPNTFQIHAVPM